MTDARDVNPYDAVIGDVEAQIAKMQTMLQSLKTMRALSSGASEIPSAISAVGATGVPHFSHDAFFGMTVGDAAKKYLATTKRTASANTIGEALLAGGWKTSSKNVVETIRAILGRNSDFVKINGEFGLAEWYPGRGSGRKNRRTSGTTEPNDEQNETPSETNSDGVSE